MTTIGLLIGSMPLARTQHHLARLLSDVAPTGTTVVELDARALPQHGPYGDVPAPADALAWKRLVGAVDGLVVLTPTIERSIPGSLKNAIDWAGGTAAPNALAGMPTVISGVSMGNLPRFASIQHLRTVLSDAGAALKSQPETVLFAAPEVFDADGAPLDEELVAEARALMSAAAGLIAHERRARAAVPTAASAAPTAPAPALIDDTEVLAERVTTLDPVAEVLAAAPGPASPARGVPVEH